MSFGRLELTHPQRQLIPTKHYSVALKSCAFDLVFVCDISSFFFFFFFFVADIADGHDGYSVFEKCERMVQYATHNDYHL
jgi:hypothetical protein